MWPLWVCFPVVFTQVKRSHLTTRQAPSPTLFVVNNKDTEAEAPTLWPPDAKSQLTGKDPDAGKAGGEGHDRG